METFSFFLNCCFVLIELHVMFKLKSCWYGLKIDANIFSIENFNLLLSFLREVSFLLRHQRNSSKVFLALVCEETTELFCKNSSKKTSNKTRVFVISRFRRKFNDWILSCYRSKALVYTCLSRNGKDTNVFGYRTLDRNGTIFISCVIPVNV